MLGGMKNDFTIFLAAAVIVAAGVLYLAKLCSSFCRCFISIRSSLISSGSA
jgi:hypothetical protein